jgi:ubiquitin-conjugating enzyme E2 T
MLKELAILQEATLDGIKIKITGSALDIVEAEIMGPQGSRFENYTSKLELKLSDMYDYFLFSFKLSIFRFPFEPPSARFVSPVRHPNVDEVSGRICLDLLKMPPGGSWRPNVSLSSVLVSIQVLLGCPNLNDVVRPELIAEFSTDKPPIVTEDNFLVEKENAIVERKRPIGLSLSLSSKKSKLQGDNKSENS